MHAYPGPANAPFSSAPGITSAYPGWDGSVTRPSTVAGLQQAMSDMLVQSLAPYLIIAAPTTFFGYAWFYGARRVESQGYAVFIIVETFPPPLLQTGKLGMARAPTRRRSAPRPRRSSPTLTARSAHLWGLPTCPGRCGRARLKAHASLSTWQTGRGAPSRGSVHHLRKRRRRLSQGRLARHKRRLRVKKRRRLELAHPVRH